ncbi:MAG: sugar isomerase [Alkalispirochaeta sp.]
MAIEVTQAAREAGIITDPQVGLLIMGRKRPGFDPEWGAATKKRISRTLAALPYPVTTPSQNIADEHELREAVEQCRVADVTVLVVVQPTISDGRLAPLLSRLWSGPLLMWATPEKPTGRMISANSLVGTHVMSATLRQLGHPLEIVYGDPEDAEIVYQVDRAIRAIHTADSVENRIVGLIGNHAPGFVDFHADPVFLSDALGSQLYHMSSIELIQRVRSYSETDIADELAAFTAMNLPWSADATEAGFPSGHGPAGAGSGSTAATASTETTASSAPPDEELAMQARYYRAFREIFAEHNLDTLAFRCWPDLPSELGHWPYLALARLVSEGFPISMEGDVDGALGGRIAESAGIGPVYLSDWLQHDHETITIWHTGAAPFQLSRPDSLELSVQFNNKRPTVVQSVIREEMEATLFRIWRFDGEYHMSVLEGSTIAPERDLMATNGVFHTDRVDIRDWFEAQVQRGMPHHVCIVEGHHGELLSRIGRLMDAVVG